MIHTSRSLLRVGVPSKRALFSTKPFLHHLTYTPLPDKSPNYPLLQQILLEITNLTVKDEPRAITFTPVFGGITNQLFRADFQNLESDPLLVRIFGGEGMIDRTIENAVFSGLAAKGVAPSYLGRFANGRVEGWYSNAEPLELDQMSDPNLSTKVACEMAKLHTYTIPSDIINDDNKTLLTQPAMWNQLESWLQQAKDTASEIEHRWGKEVGDRFRSLHETYYSSTDEPGSSSFNFDRVDMELQQLKKNMPYSPTIFAHNDLLAGNIMLHTDTGDAKLIDFEYGGVNYRGFDIANHWNEWAGGTQEEMNGVCEYHRFPSPAEQINFCRAYLEQAALEDTEALFLQGEAATWEGTGGGALDQDELFEAALNSINTKPKVTEEDVLSLVEEANQFVLVNHWYWGLWAVNQTTMEGVEGFDYLTYAESRAKRYYETSTGTTA